MHDDPPDIAAAKRALRDASKALRSRDAALSADVCHWLRTHLHTRKIRSVACTWPLEHEIDLRPLCHALHQDGLIIGLPETPKKGHPLTFRLWRPGCAMQPGRFGTQHPEGPVMTPDIVLVPMLAFDRRGYRLGYGGGYYDRTLAALPHARPVGYASSMQEKTAIPTGPHDIALPVIVTEREIIHCSAGKNPGQDDVTTPD